MGMFKLSEKVKRPPMIGAVYWSARGMHDFIPSVAYDVPVTGGNPSEGALDYLKQRIYSVEQFLHRDNVIGVHIEKHGQDYLTITIGCFAT